MEFVYLAHNFETNEQMVLTEEQLETYAPEIALGTIEIMETVELEDKSDCS